jgi:DNA-binding Lrp family transcriptional regulator
LSLHLTKLQRQLCNALQSGLPVCQRPFAGIAKSLDSDEKKILQEVSELKKTGIIRRICALINYHALGRISTLVAAHVPQANLQKVADAVNCLKMVSHNYLREHYYNLWFTLQGQTAGEIELTLAGLSGRFGIDFHSLPAERIFKLDVRFDAEDEGQLLVNTGKVPESKTIQLNDIQKRILSKLQNDIEPIARPFDFLCDKNLDIEEALRVITQLMEIGVVRRIAAVLDHNTLGFTANVLFAAEVGADRIDEVGRELAMLPTVSHCYQRKTFKNWSFNLFAMMHSKTKSDIQDSIKKFVESEEIKSFELLPTVAELKKQPIRYRFQ